MSLSTALWLLGALSSGVISGLSWLMVKRLIASKRNGILPPNGSSRFKEAWIIALQQRITVLEEEAAIEHRHLINARESIKRLETKRLHGE
jgi:hypothetical protein